MTTHTQNKANLILIACVLINLSIGVLYAWSVFKTEMIEAWGWTSQQSGLPYTLAIVFFSLAAFLGGRIQDKFGPRWVVTTGGTLVGIGMIISGLVGNSPVGMVIGFGVIVGAGIGLAYSCVLPPALKWFHPSKKGFVGGIVVGAFGLAAVFFAPVAKVLLGSFGIEQTMIMFGVATLLISVPIAQFIKNPPAGYTPPVPENLKNSATENAQVEEKDYTRAEMLQTARFYYLFPMFLFSSSVGLMIIGNMSKIATLQGIGAGVVAMLVAFLAVTNSFGRIGGGLMSDKIGRVNALFVVFALQAANMVGFMFYQSTAMLMFGIVIVGFAYGTLLSVFPAITADLYGKKNFGANYGIMYLAWGASGVVAPIIADYFYDKSLVATGVGSFNTAYLICAIMMASLLFVNYLLKRNLQTLKN